MQSYSNNKKGEIFYVSLSMQLYQLTPSCMLKCLRTLLRLHEQIFNNIRTVLNADGSRFICASPL